MTNTEVALKRQKMTGSVALLGLLGLMACDSDSGGPLDVDAATDVQHDASADVSADVGADAQDVWSPPAYPEPWERPANTGPGGPNVTFTAEQLFENCAFLPNDPRDTHVHHNLHVMYDGWLVKPWAPEWGGGGIAFYRFDDPCNAEQIGGGFSARTRESHSIGFSHVNGAWAVVNQLVIPFQGGIQFWDISDPTAPEPVYDLDFPNHRYPDAYARVVLSLFWQAPYVYAAHADLGVVIVDATDPRAPQIVGSWQTEPILRAGQIHAIGDLLVVSATEGPRTVLLDISNPSDPQPIPGGDFIVTDEEGVPRGAYFSNFGAGMTVYARKDGGSGVILYDVTDPTTPRRAGGFRNNGSGGYVFMKDQYVFTGESSFGALYDISDLDDIVELGRFHLAGDLDTVTPIGNVALVSVDDAAVEGQGTAIAPWRETPDREPPYVNFVWPRDGSMDLAPTSRIGVGFNEMIDVKSAFAGSVRLWETDKGPVYGRVEGHISVQENIVNFWPVEGLSPNTAYTFEIPAGGILDYNGNAIETPFVANFRTR
jgi:hypothetical protein